MILFSARGKARPRFFTHLIVIAGCVLMIYPILWMVSASIKPETEIFTTSSLLPSSWSLDNYVQGWNALSYPFGTFFINSCIVCAGAVLGNLIACSMAAFAFARLRFKFKGFWFALMLGTIMLPANVVIVPQYVLFKSLGWVNTFLPLIVPKFLATDAFFIFLLVQFIRAIPRDLDDAARIDGCNLFQRYWRIIMPLAMPALATTAIFTFIFTFNEFFNQLIFLNDQASYTVPIALRAFQDSSDVSSFGQLFAMSVLSLIPIFGFFVAFQRLLIEGISTSGIKG
ncbi:MAG TPA: carbohydrate ABC transporter permease [Ktedonosporobacter sp.]|nr:carbohydrate ABC transporter permease [Ktedonosporobacter sp.]